MSYTEEDWVDEDATAHRGMDDYFYNKRVNGY